MISAILHTGVKAEKPNVAAPTSSSDIFLQMLTQEFQTSNGLVDPSLSNANTQPGANAAKLNKLDPNAKDANNLSATTADSHAPLKKAVGKDAKEAQVSKGDDPNTPVPTVVAPAPQVPITTPPPIQVLPNADTVASTATSGDDKKKSDQTSALAIPGQDSLNGQPNAAPLSPAIEKLKGKQGQADVSPVPPQDVDGAKQDGVQKSAEPASPNTASAVMGAMRDAKPSVDQIAKPAITDSIAAPKRAEAAAHKDAETSAVTGSTSSDASAPANDPTAMALNAAMAVPNQSANQPVNPDNRLPIAKLRTEQSGNSASQIGDGSEKKAKDNDLVAAIKSTGRKDESQLGAQDGQQAPASSDQQIPAAADSAFHSAVVQQIHAAVGASSAVSHSSPNLKTAMPGNSLQPPLQQNLGPVHDAALPVTTGLLQSVKLVERLGQSELRVGLQVGDMGGVDIRTSMAHNQLTAEISVEHPELGHLLEANLPSLQNRLSEHQFQTANILLQNQTSGSFSGSEQRNRQDNGSQTAAPVERIPFSRADSFSRVSILSNESVETNAGLDIHI